jgi:hypothetical protein
MNDEQRQEIIRRLQQGEELSPEWARILFPPEKREYELVYHGKEREEDIIANPLAVPRKVQWIADAQPPARGRSSCVGSAVSRWSRAPRGFVAARCAKVRGHHEQQVESRFR